MYSKIKFFADDVAITTSEYCIQLHQDLNGISSWADRWQLRLNATKCEALLISRKHSPVCLTIVLRAFPYRGNLWFNLLFGSLYLDWSDHYKITAAKATRCLKFLRHTMWSAPCNPNSLAYKSLIRRIMEYGCQVWNPHQRQWQH